MKQIENIKVKPIDMCQHRVELRRALLTSSYWDKSQNDIFLFVKGGEKIMQKNKFITAVFALGIMVLVIAAGIILMPKNTKTAYAQQLVQQSSQAISQLTPEQLQALRQKLALTAPGPDELLQEAKTAKDLQTLTYDQFMSEYGNIKMGFGTKPSITTQGVLMHTQVPIPSGPPPEKMDMHNLKFLQFTDTNGDNVVLGIDKNNLPVFVFGKGKDGATFGAIRDTGNPKTQVGGDIQIQGGMEGMQNSQNAGVETVMSSDGKTLTVHTASGDKKYEVPAGASAQSAIQVDKNGNVYINGVQATPEQ